MTTEEVTIPLHRPSLAEKVFFLLSGVIVSVPMTLFVMQFSDILCIPLPFFYAEICSVAVFTPFVEEFAKAYPLFYRHGETEKSMFVLGFLAGTGFGFSEFILYVATLGAPVPTRLALMAFHSANASITAYGIAVKKPLQFYLIAVMLHLSNNLLALAGDVWLIGGPATLFVAYLLSYTLYRKTSDRIIPY